MAAADHPHDTETLTFHHRHVAAKSAPRVRSLHVGSPLGIRQGEELAEPNGVFTVYKWVVVAC